MSILRQKVDGRIAVAVLLLPALVWFWMDYTSLSSRFDRLREGMSRAEVEAILGPPSWESPPLDPDRPDPNGVIGQPILPSGKIVAKHLRWAATAASFHVYFDEDGAVVGKLHISTPLSLRQRAGLWWYRVFRTPPPF